MARFSVTGATIVAVDAGEAVGVLWNPHGSMALRVCSIEFTTLGSVAGGSTIWLSRVTTTGTAGSTITPDADNHHGRRAAPESGALYYRGNFTVAPTESTPSLFRAVYGAVLGSSVGWYFPKRQPLIVPAGQGLALFTVTALTNGHLSWTWEE